MTIWKKCILTWLVLEGWEGLETQVVIRGRSILGREHGNEQQIDVSRMQFVKVAQEEEIGKLAWTQIAEDFHETSDFSLEFIWYIMGSLKAFELHFRENYRTIGNVTWITEGIVLKQNSQIEGIAIVLIGMDWNCQWRICITLIEQISFGS